MKIRENCKWAMVVATSMGVRICPPNGQAVETSDTFFMHATSAETNVASISSYLGLPVKVLTTFVKGSPIAEFIKRDLRGRGMAFEGKEVAQGGPWGYRHQFNVADSGFGSRGPRVHNDRAGEVGRTLNIADFDIDRIFNEEGVGILHLSGLIAALSPETAQFCLALARAAKKYKTLISFDLNYRETFWKNRKEELYEVFSEIADLADILVGNEEDFQLALKIEGPKEGGANLSDKIDGFKAMVVKIKKRYPNATLFANTLRQVVDVNTHLWGAVMLFNDEWHIIEPREIKVLDRIGGGDGFVGGLLYSTLKGFEGEKRLQFAWATGALAATVLTDYAQPVDEEQVWSIWQGNARVRR